MSTPVFLAVILAACLHAIWNVLQRARGQIRGHVGGCPCPWPCADCAVGVALCAAAAGPWIIASVILHLGYQLFLIAGYRVGDLTLVYPIARGSAPIVVTVLSVAVLGVSFTRTELLGVFFIALGLVSLALVRRTDGTRNPRAVMLALCTGGLIAAYCWSTALVRGWPQRPLAIGCGAALGNAVGLGL